MKTLFSSSKLNLVFACTVLLALGILNFGCSENLGVLKENKPPTVWLSSAPPEGDVSKYRIQLFWGGWDPDGEIQYYEYAVTDNDSGFFDPVDTTSTDDFNPWHRVYSNDSTFIFTADVPLDSIDPGSNMAAFNFIRTHTFLIRAVDDQGLATPPDKVAYRSFTARTLSPRIKVEIPSYTGMNAALLPPITKFTWVAVDFVDNLLISKEPDSVRWVLLSIDKFDKSFNRAIEYIRRNPNAPEWYRWQFYRAPMDSGKSHTFGPLPFGKYVFAMQAKDEAGAITPVFDERMNVRRINISWRSTGPQLSVRNRFIGTFKSMRASDEFAIVDLPAAVPLQFKWTADASSYGGVVSGYRYGWDISDLNIDEQWAVDWTPFPCPTCEVLSPTETWFFGLHTFHVEAIDNSGFLARIGIKINIVPFTMERNLLFVDDYLADDKSAGWFLTKGASPSDAEQDAFWEKALINVDGFNPVVDVAEPTITYPLSISKLSQYRTLIWNTSGGYNIREENLPTIYDMIKYLPENPDIPILGKVQPNLIALFLAAGGHVLLCGNQPMTMVFNKEFSPSRVYPFIFQYELLGNQSGDYRDQVDDPIGDQSFAYMDACIDVLDISYTTWTKLRQPGDTGNGCGVIHVRTVDKVNDGLRECLPVDPNFPTLTIRPECTNSDDKYYHVDKQGYNDELYNPPYFVCGYLDLGPRDCFEPIYAHGCLNENSAIYEAPNAAWTNFYADVIPDWKGVPGIPARSAVWGFAPVYFDTLAVRQALEYILFEEWKLPSK